MINISLIIPFKFEGDCLFFWLQKRETQDSLHGLMEFPGGKVESNETPHEAVLREVLEEASIKIEMTEILELGSILSDPIVFHLFGHNNASKWPESGWKSEAWILENLALIPPRNRNFISSLIVSIKSMG